MKKRTLKNQNQKQKLPEEFRILSAHKHEHNHQHQFTISPFPSALEMEKIHALNPDVLNTMVSMAQQQIQADIKNSEEKINLEKNEQALRKLEVIGDIEHKKRAQNYGLIALVFLGTVTLGLVYQEAYKTAAAFATITIIGGTTAFTGFGNKTKKKDDDDKE